MPLTLALPRLALIVLTATLAAAPALAQPWEDEEPWDQPAPPPNVSAHDEPDGSFDRAFALGIYLTHWHASYEATGVGGRLRAEIVGDVGLDLHASVLAIETEGPSRVDLPLGFSIYAPIALSDAFRLRVLGGFCTVFSLGAGATPGQRKADDIRFGFHAGGGAELSLGSHWSLFADVMYQGYFGHGYDHAEWGDSISGELELESSVQGLVGVAFHL